MSNRILVIFDLPVLLEDFSPIQLLIATCLRMNRI